MKVAIANQIVEGHVNKEVFNVTSIFLCEINSLPEATITTQDIFKIYKEKYPFKLFDDIAKSVL